MIRLRVILGEGDEDEATRLTLTPSEEIKRRIDSRNRKKSLLFFPRETIS